MPKIVVVVVLVVLAVLAVLVVRVVLVVLIVGKSLEQAGGVGHKSVSRVRTAHCTNDEAHDNEGIAEDGHGVLANGQQHTAIELAF